MQYAIIQTGGKQYQVELGQILEVELLHAEGTVTFDQVLLLVDGDDVQIGTPILDKVVVKAEIVGDVKGDKIDILRYKSKSRYRKHTGHRQKYTKVKITALGKHELQVEEAKKTVTKAKAPKKTVAKAAK